MRNALSRLRTDEELREMFGTRLIPLLFARNKPGFEQCLAEFSTVAKYFLEHGQLA